MQDAGPNPNTGHHTPATPAIQHGHHANDKGDTNTQTGVGAAVPALYHYATPPHNATPPSTTPPPTTTVRGE